jgi:hypothetical protein
MKKTRGGNLKKIMDHHLANAFPAAQHKISAFVQIVFPSKKRKAGVPGKKW